MSTTQTRKQRELSQRQARILEVARPMLVDEGYLGLSMDRVAEALQYSKGTIYNHFSCKEEIILALAIETMEQRTGMFERAASFSGRSRERILAIGAAAELFVRLYPDHFVLEQIIRSASIWEKTSEQRRSVMRSCEGRCMSIVAGVVRDAVAHGDLSLPAHCSPADLVFGLWSTSLGAFSIITTSDQLQELGIERPFEAFGHNVRMMLDGYGWQPLSHQDDLESAMRRVQEEVFADEFRSLGL